MLEKVDEIYIYIYIYIVRPLLTHAGLITSRIFAIRKLPVASLNILSWIRITMVLKERVILIFLMVF